MGRSSQGGVLSGGAGHKEQHIKRNGRHCTSSVAQAAPRNQGEVLPAYGFSGDARGVASMKAEVGAIGGGGGGDSVTWKVYVHLDQLRTCCLLNRLC